MERAFYRPPSKTESHIDIRRTHLLYDFDSLVNGVPKKKTNEIGTQTEYDKSELIINKLVLFFMHLFLITMFELIFFFNYVTKFENSALTGVFDSLTGSIINSCSSLSPNSKIFLDDIFRIFVNTTQSNQKATNSYNSRMLYNNNLMAKSMLYFIGVLIANIMILSMNKMTINKRINYLEIIIDNLIMITLLGIYEYIFFSNIVFKYQTISNDEIFDNFQNKYLANC